MADVTSAQRRLPGQPFVAIASVMVAGSVLSAAWFITVTGNGGRISARDALLALCLVLALVLSYHFPVHVDLSSKVYMGSIVLYLMATLLAPAFAASTIGLGLLAGELSACHRTGNHLFPPVIPTQVARWTLVGLGASLVAHVPSTVSALPLVATAVAMWSGDILTGPLLLSPLLQRNPVRIIAMMIREGGVVEAIQYVIGLVGALVAVSQPWALILLVPPAGLVYVAFKRAKDISAQTRDMLVDMADSVDLRDAYSRGHSQRVAELVQEMLCAMGKGGPKFDPIVFAARVHDVGKIRVPDEILRKPGELTPAEWTIVKTHSDKGADLVARYSDLVPSAEIIRHHHETWDGNGYPQGLKGTEIPFGSRVLAVAETYDAMTNDRPQRLRMAPNEAATILRDGRGRQWDAEVVEALLHSLRDLIDEPAKAQLRLVPDRGPDSERR